jgi:hypothetical protein
MGLLDQIIGTLGGQEPVERLAREEANFDDPQSPDSRVVRSSGRRRSAVQDAMAQAAQRVDPRGYEHHPRVRGTDPLGTGGGALGTLASRCWSLTGGACRAFPAITAGEGARPIRADEFSGGGQPGGSPGTSPRLRPRRHNSGAGQGRTVLK